jgi:hypothetical protein
MVMILLLLLKLTRLLCLSLPFPGQQKRKEAFSRGPQAEARPLREQAEGGRDRGGGESGRARRGREGQGQEDEPKTASGRSWLCRSCLAQNQKTERTIDEIELPWKSEGLAVVGTRCLESTYDDKRHAIQTPQINATGDHGRRVDPERKSLMSLTKSREGKERQDGQHLITRNNKKRHRRQGYSNVRWCESRRHRRRSGQKFRHQRGISTSESGCAFFLACDNLVIQTTGTSKEGVRFFQGRDGVPGKIYLLCHYWQSKYILLGHLA